jgi:hypothetical protein
MRELDPMLDQMAALLFLQMPRGRSLNIALWPIKAPS